MTDPAAKVTFACMLSTDGSRSTYGVFRGPLFGSRDGYSCDVDESTRIARVWKRPGQDFTHADMEGWYATPEAPSFMAIVNGSDETGAPMG